MIEGGGEAQSVYYQGVYYKAVVSTTHIIIIIKLF